MASKFQRKQVADRWGHVCFYCAYDLSLGGRLATLDHLIPRARGGSLYVENLVPACDGCNNAKADMMWWEYAATDEYKKRREATANEQVSKKPRVLRSLSLDEGQLQSA